MQKNANHTSYSSLVTIGDSFTEGMSDLLPDGSYRGWADVLAGRMAARTPGFRYANLAVRGKLIGQIVDEQVDVAAAMGADVITLVGGLNDTLRPKVDMGRVRGLLEEAVEKLAPACEQLVLMRSPGRNGPVMERFRPRMEELFACIDDLAARHGAVVVDLYGPPALGDPRMWDVDRLHLTAEGHRRVAEAVWQALGHEPEGDWQSVLPPDRAAGVGHAPPRRRPLRQAAPGPVDRPPPDGPLLRRRPPGEAPRAVAVRGSARLTCRDGGGARRTPRARSSVIRVACSTASASSSSFALASASRAQVRESSGFLSPGQCRG